MANAYYQAQIVDFLAKDNTTIRQELLDNDEFQTSDLQKNAWTEEIKILKDQLQQLSSGTIILEYLIPRIAKRIDVVLIINGIVLLIEFKVGKEEKTRKATQEQVMDYALDLKYFHEESRERIIVPITCETESVAENNTFTLNTSLGISNVQICNKTNLQSTIDTVLANIKGTPIDTDKWINARFAPVPTIVQAAQALYRKHSVVNIKHHTAGDEDLSRTTKTVNRIIDYCKANSKKAICFITGVPGAGKTLAGLDIANSRSHLEDEDHVAFLSGNEPLVDVLQEALARDIVSRDKTITKKDALRETRSFIWLIHKYRDEAIRTSNPLFGKIAVFDEAQRAWNTTKLSEFMKTKKGVPGFNMSEPEFLISIMDRHNDWAVLVCLIGGGQEIYDGEGGMETWFDALKNGYLNWDIYMSSHLKDAEYVGDKDLDELLAGRHFIAEDDLHLDVDIRSFRSKQLSKFVKELLDNNPDSAKSYYESFKNDYPILLTRDIEKAKEWVKNKAHGSERYGLLASSEGKRLRAEGIWVPKDINHVAWFLNDKDCVNSSYYLEVPASEFKVQGLEVDYAILAWDADFRYENGDFTYHKFRNKWNNVKEKYSRRYMKNAYRVLLTRARQGLVIYIPQGNAEDSTALPSLYDGTYNYLKSIGLETI